MMTGAIDNNRRRRVGAGVLAVAAAAFLLASCGPPKDRYPVGEQERKLSGDPYKTVQETRGSVLGEGGLTVLGEGNIFSNNSGEGGGGAGIGVNSFLWRASLDTVSFMPLASADPFGGVIITDWYSPEGVSSERFKVNVYILGRQLRADGLRAAVFRQVQNANGAWVDAPVEEGTARDLENAILTRARQLRVAGVE